MKNITNVSLSFCCQEDWNSFESLDERTKFCATCQHRVVDFTQATAEDFEQAKKAGSLCGRFKRSQLSAAFLLSIAVSATTTACTEEIAPPSMSSPTTEEILPIDEVASEFMTTGVVFFEDTTAVASDSIPPLNDAP